MDNNSTIKIMLVDDSAVIRGMINRILSNEEDMEVVKSVSDGQQALNALNNTTPDVIILDVEMPVMDGMSALPQILEKSPKSRVIMCSTLTVRNAAITLDALGKGATECIGKPTSPQDIKDGGEFQQNLVNIVRGLGQIGKPAARAPRPASPSVPGEIKSPTITGGIKTFTLKSEASAYAGVPQLIAIGSSTGGPQALFTVLAHLKDAPVPIIITQHMPATFTKILAQHITSHTGVTSCEAEDGMPLEKGVAYVAPGGFHMLFEKNENRQVVIKLDSGPPVNFCKPAVDPMLESAIKIYGNKILCTILTGMGHDGLNGAKALSESGGRVIAQDEETSTVWGMPGAVAVAGICNAVLPLDKIGPYIYKQAFRI